MKKTIMCSVIMLFVQVAIMAQSPATATPAPAPTGKMEKMPKQPKQPKMPAAERAVQYSTELKSKLSLSDDQYQKVLAVNTECITRKDALRGNQDHDATKSGKDAIKAYRLGEFQKIFTADQLKAYQGMNQHNDGGQGDGNDHKKHKGADDKQH